jgi:hypothetical protein
MARVRTVSSAMVVGMILAPVLLCLLGVGTFLHLMVSAVGGEEQEQARRRQQLRDLTDRAGELEQQLSQMGRQAAGVQCQLAREREASEAAQKQTEELRRLQTERSQQEAELAELHAQLAAAKTAADCAERGAGQTRDEIRRAEQRVHQLERDLATASAARSTGSPAPNGKSAPPVAPDDWEARLARQRAAWEASQAESQQLAAQLAQLQRRPDPSTKTVRVERIRGTQAWHAPDPVYVECDATGVILQPAGRHFSASPNAEQRDAFLQAAQRSGYVLFLIRPAGFESFRQYRAAVAAGRQASGKPIDFGYEPVNADWHLVYPENKST